MRFALILFLFAIQPDGLISRDEWKDAREYDLGNGNKVLLKKDKDVLYVAMNSSQPFWAHMYLSDGKSLKVMHASAALGAIEYKIDGSFWRTDDKSFVYELRDREYNEAKVNEYYSKHGWVANNNNMGDKRTIEAKIKLEQTGPLYFSCVIAQGDKFYSFPQGAGDDTILKKLVQGYVADSLKFAPTNWHHVIEK